MHAAKARWKLGPRCDKRPTVEKGDAPRAEQRQKTYASDSHEQVRQRASHPQPFLPPTPPLFAQLVDVLLLNLADACARNCRMILQYDAAHA